MCFDSHKLQLEIYHPSMYRAYFRKNDMEEPPPVDDGDEDKETPAHVIQNSKAEDESNLEARFYRYGVRPDWLQIHRILRHRLVKIKGKACILANFFLLYC